MNFNIVWAQKFDNICQDICHIFVRMATGPTLSNRFSRSACIFPAKRRRITRRKYCFWITLIVSNAWNAGRPMGKWKCQLSRLEPHRFVLLRPDVSARDVSGPWTRLAVLNTPPTSGIYVSYVNSNNNNNSNNRMKKKQARTLWLCTTMTVLLLLLWCWVVEEDRIRQPRGNAQWSCVDIRRNFKRKINGKTKGFLR